MENQKVIFIASNSEHIEVFKITQTFKQVFNTFSDPIDSIDIENENEDINKVRLAIEKYVNENNIAEYKCYMQF